jgi:hypothetical protein
MNVLDVFSRTFLPLAAQAGIPIPVLSRHMPVFRRYVDPDEPTMLVSRCARAERPMGRRYIVMLTKRHLVVTRETPLLRRPKVYLEADVSTLEGVTWTTDLAGAAVDFAVSTAAKRERFSIRALYPRQMWRLEAALGQVFRPSSLFRGNRAVARV